MHLIRGLTNLQPLTKGCVLSIGNFDGVHIGHQKIIEKLALQGKAMNIAIVIMLFEPQPLEFFLGNKSPSRLMRLREKVIRFKKFPIDKLLVVKFDKTLANYKAENFISHFLVNKLNVKYLVVGDDFRFGKARLGNFAMLKKTGQLLGFNVVNTRSCYKTGQRISSTLIRDALCLGDLAQAKKLLGRDYSICGRIVYGNNRGSTIGFPTANILMFRKNTPLKGVYAVTMTWATNKEIPGIANVGTRPTVTGTNTVILETHLFNFNQNIYGQYVEVHFKHKIRNEISFDSLDALKTQIAKDVTVAKLFFTQSYNHTNRH